MDIIYWSVHTFIRRVWDGVKGVDRGIVILARCKFHFTRVHDYLV